MYNDNIQQSPQPTLSIISVFDWFLLVFSVSLFNSKIMKQDEELHNLVEELELQVNQEKEQLKQKVNS